jgi:serine/threonine protein kinase
LAGPLRAAVAARSVASPRNTIPSSSAQTAYDVRQSSTSDPEATATESRAIVADQRTSLDLEEAPDGALVPYFGDYVLLEEIGRGGMGVVYKARQASLRRLVALKVLREGAFAGEDDRRRFQTEAEAVAALDHPGIIPVYEVGEYLGRRYFSMKYIPGRTLAARLDDYANRFDAAASLVVTLSIAIDHAHQRGILHRDLKPANILIDERNLPLVTDFGLAKRVEGDSALTQSGAILGTPSYMAPEQGSGHRASITTAADIYGLGAILYALLTRRAPFAGDSVIDTLEQLRTRSPEPPTRIDSRVPPDLEVICLKCLEKEPGRRYASAAALGDEGPSRRSRGAPCGASGTRSSRRSRVL